VDAYRSDLAKSKGFTGDDSPKASVRLIYPVCSHLQRQTQDVSVPSAGSVSLLRLRSKAP
jgi:hypothetical protein